MPVTKSAKQALRTATRRHEENILQRNAFKQAIKSVKKAVLVGSDQISVLLSEAQSTLDKAAKKHTIHPNKAARLKSRLAKRIATTTTELATPKKKATKSKISPSKAKSKSKK